MSEFNLQDLIKTVSTAFHGETSVDDISKAVLTRIVDLGLEYEALEQALPACIRVSVHLNRNRARDSVETPKREPGSSRFRDTVAFAWWMRMLSDENKIPTGRNMLTPFAECTFQQLEFAIDTRRKHAEATIQQAEMYERTRETMVKQGATVPREIKMTDELMDYIRNGA